MAVDKNAVIKEAQKFVAKGQFDKAILEWRKLLKDYPSDSAIFNTIGDLCLKKGDAKGKAEAVEAYYRAGTILAAEGFSSKAIAVYKKVLNIDPKKIEVHLALGDMNAEKGLTGNALESYKLAADHYLHNKEIRKALPVYQKMADLNPANVAFRIKLADMYAKEGMKKEAIEAYLLAADVHIAKEAYKEARQLFEKALALDPNSKEVYHKAGIVYFKEGKFVEACKALKSVYEGDPSNKALAELYLEALTKAGRDAEAEELCKKLLSENADRIDLREKLFHIYLAKKDHDKALAEAAVIAEARLKAREIKKVEGRKLLPGAGEAELDESTNAALETLKGLVAESPDFADARRTLADFYAKVGHGSDAAEELIQAAEILIGDGNKDGAKAALARAIELAPDMAEARQRLESLQASPPAPEPEPLVAAPPVAQPAPTIAETPAAAVPPPTSPAAALRALEEDPAIAEAFTEVDVLVKYGLAAKALEQLEGVARKHPESLQVRTRLRDLYKEQGDVRKAAEHSIILADLYAAKGMPERVEPLLRAALELDPANAVAQSRLGIAPSAPAAAAYSPVRTEAPAIELPPAEAPVFEAAPPPAEEPADFMTSLAMTPFEPGEEPTFPEAPAGEAPLEEAEQEPFAPAEPAFEEPFTAPAAPEEKLPPVEEMEAAGMQQPAPEEVIERPHPTPPRGVPVREVPEKEPDLNEVWAEAEFYYQQGLFDEAKKHYAKIIQYNPGDKRAIDRLTEISREAEETQEFSKLAEAVDELEGLAAGGSEGALAESASDEEAVRTLMQEIAELKQKHEPAPPAFEEPSEAIEPEPSRQEQQPAPPAFDESLETFEPEPPRQKQQPTPPVFDESFDALEATPPRGIPAAREQAEEDFFDLGAELRGEPAAGSGAASGSGEKSEDFFDLASELRDELSGIVVPPASTSEDQSLDDIFEEFKKGVEEQAVKEDVDTHYNLGVAYKEMGLLDDAIAEFILTPEDEPKFIQSRYMLGLCYMEKDEYQNAINEIQHALNMAERSGRGLKDSIGMHYDLGLAYQGVGNVNGALEEFQKVCDTDPGYRDAINKIKELQQGDFISLEQLKDDIEKEISSKFLEEGERIEREEKTRKNEKVRG